MKKLKSNYGQRKLPHIYPKDASFFVTFRLYGSIPQAVLKQLWLEKLERLKKKRQKNYSAWQKDRYYADKVYFLAIDRALERYSHKDDYLKKPEIAQIVADKMKTYDKKYYDLVAYCIMSNHVHVLFKTEGYAQSMPNYSVSRIMQLIKGGSARCCNQVLGREGAFWEEESYDHYVRNSREFDNILAYILNNPVKAGLVEHWEDYPFNFLWAAGF